MSTGLPVLRFAWWNTQMFAHFDPKWVGQRGWPVEQAQYVAKCNRIDAALRSLITQHPPDLLGLCEITATAAEELRTRLFPDYDLVYPDTTPEADFQVVALYRRSGFRSRLPVSASRVPRTTRDMVVVDHQRGGQCVRFILCHWTAFGENSRTYRDRLAEAVSGAVYRFMRNSQRTATAPHAVVLGDFNMEPFEEVLQQRLHAHRDREHALQRPHPSDQDVHRFRLYNTGWRLLGERHPHDGTGAGQQVAGTYYHEGNRAWHTYDQTLVTGSLLTTTAPYLDESSLRIMVLPGCLGASGKPETFRWEGGQATGLSDHLPIVGHLVLSGS